MKSFVRFSILTLPTFDKELAKIISKYPDFRKTFEDFTKQLEINPEQGNHLGGGVFKVRINIPGKPTGKRYGARVINAIFSISKEILLLRIYDKSDVKDLTKEEEKAYRLMANEIRKTKAKNTITRKNIR